MKNKKIFYAVIIFAVILLIWILLGRFQLNLPKHNFDKNQVRISVCTQKCEDKEMACYFANCFDKKQSDPKKTKDCLIWCAKKGAECVTACK